MTTPERKSKSAELRKDILTMLYRCQSGHPGGSLSVLEILMALYYDVMNVRPKEPQWEDRDRLVLSKGHAAPALYAILADLGFFPKEDLAGLRQLASHLQGHPDMHKTPGIDASTGSLGQGASIAGGLAMAAKQKNAGYKIYAVLGDGELQEGIVWEAAMSAAHYRLDNLVFLLDHNGLQIDGSNDKVMALGDVAAKFKAFGFHCSRVDGHDADAIANALRQDSDGRPKFIDCVTKKGKGISFMEGQYGWHGRMINEDEYKSAMNELGGVS
ncbi:MAG: transketolase [Oscillospiraceae bacterium]|nr:transketolase [Oscillospiraceae bacterium]